MTTALLWSLMGQSFQELDGALQVAQRLLGGRSLAVRPSSAEGIIGVGPRPPPSNRPLKLPSPISPARCRCRAQGSMCDPLIVIRQPAFVGPLQIFGQLLDQFL